MSDKTYKILKKYKNLKPHEFFYKNGFLKFEYNENIHFENLKERCKSSIDFTKKGWSWVGKDKYKEQGTYTSLDLRSSKQKSSANSYNHIYEKKDIEFLFESGIYDDITRVTGRDLVLVMINYRIALKGKSGKSNRGLHRDSHLYGDTPKYFYPAPINLHLYPCFGKRSTSQLKFWEGTNHLQTDNKFIDKLYSKIIKPCEFSSSDSVMYLIDTSSLHQVSSEVKTEGHFRLMYSFLNRNCFELKNEDMQQCHKIFLEIEKKYK